DAAELRNHLARHANFAENFFTALNTAFFQDGAFVSVAAGADVTQPVQLLFVSTSENPGATAQTRNLILAGRAASLKLVESYASFTAAAQVTNTVTELVLGEAARVEHCRIQNENHRSFHIATVQAVQEKDSHWLSHSIASGGRFARNQIQALL